MQLVHKPFSSVVVEFLTCHTLVTVDDPQDADGKDDVPIEAPDKLFA